MLTSEFAPVTLRGRNLRPIAIPKTNRWQYFGRAPDRVPTAPSRIYAAS